MRIGISRRRHAVAASGLLAYSSLGCRSDLVVLDLGNCNCNHPGTAASVVVLPLALAVVLM